MLRILLTLGADQLALLREFNDQPNALCAMLRYDNGDRRQAVQVLLDHLSTEIKQALLVDILRYALQNYPLRVTDFLRSCPIDRDELSYCLQRVALSSGLWQISPNENDSDDVLESYDAVQKLRGKYIDGVLWSKIESTAGLILDHFKTSFANCAAAVVLESNDAALRSFT